MAHPPIRRTMATPGSLGERNETEKQGRKDAKLIPGSFHSGSKQSQLTSCTDSDTFLSPIFRKTGQFGVRSASLKFQFDYVAFSRNVYFGLALSVGAYSPEKQPPIIFV